MKRFICLFLIILMAVASGSCTEKKEVIERPDLNLDGEHNSGFASKYQFIQIDHKGVSVVVYYDPHDKQFIGSYTNTTKKEIENISIEILLDSGEIYGVTEPVVLGPGEAEELVLKESGLIFNGWSANLSSEGKQNKKEPPVVKIADRMQDGQVVNLESNLMKVYKEFDVIKNEGIEYYGNIYAGRHQSYRLEDFGMVVEIQYLYDNMAIGGTITNTTDKTISSIGLKVIYDGEDRISTTDVPSLKPGEVRKIGFNSISWKDFEIYRPDLRRYGYYSGEERNPEIEINDVY